MKIPIQNIYYLLCYAWNKLEESEIVDVASQDETKTIIDLLSEVLANGMSYIFRRGLDRGYISHFEETSKIRGKINFETNLRQNFLLSAKLYCEYDELDHNVLHNQIIKTTIYKLLRYKELDQTIHEKLLLIFRKLNKIDVIPVTKRTFGLVQLHSNNSFYDFLLNVCELINDIVIISEDDGTVRFKDFLRDEGKMNMLFEEFVRNFYKKEQEKFKVKREDIVWKIDGIEESSKGYLPKMQTDISLTSPDQKIIIDTKYYKEALNSYYDKEKIRTANLYQMHSYMTNLPKEEGLNYKGILLYPTVRYEIDVSLKPQFGYDLEFRTINLNQDWQDIRSDLLAIVK